MLSTLLTETTLKKLAQNYVQTNEWNIDSAYKIFFEKLYNVFKLSSGGQHYASAPSIHVVQKCQVGSCNINLI